MGARAWNLAYLVVGLALGIGIGILLTDGRSDRARASPRTTGIHETLSSREVPRPGPEAGTTEWDFDRIAVEPTEVAPAVDAGRGRLEVLLPEERDVMVCLGHEVPISFLYTEEAFESSTDRTSLAWDEDRRIAMVDLAAGAYTVYWPEGTSRLIRVHREWVRPGSATRLDAREDGPPEAYPIPEGKGRLELFVADIEGGPLATANACAYVADLDGNEREIDRTTDENGTCRFHLRSGVARIRVGSRNERIRVREGKTTRLRIHYQGEGALLIDSPRQFPCLLRDSSGNSSYDFHRRSHFSPSDGLEWGFIYLAPGRYELYGPEVDRPVFTAPVTISPGRRTTLQYTPPRGALYVRLRREGAWAVPPSAVVVATNERGVEARGRVLWNSATAGRDCGYATISWLEPGHYRVTLVGKGLRADPATAEVLDSVVQLALEIRPGSG